MGELVVPVEVAGQNPWAIDQNLTLSDVSDCEILGHYWQVVANATGNYYFKTEVETYALAQELLYNLETYFLWNGLYNLYPMRLIGNSELLSQEKSTVVENVIANIFQATFLNKMGLKIISSGMSLEERVTLSGKQGINQVPLREPNNPRHQNVATIYLNARFCRDLTASYILFHSALEILSKSRHDTERNRIQMFLNDSLSTEIQNIDPAVVSSIVRKRNEIAHDGIQANFVDLRLLIDVVKPVLQFELFGSIQETIR